jgi:aldehyde dehydrogenase (NAD+)
MFQEVLDRLGIQPTQSGAFARTWLDCAGAEELVSVNPSDGKPIARVRTATANEYEQIVSTASETFQRWRLVPAPKRGEIVRQIGDALRKHKADLGMLVTIEAGKVRSEGEGEVQEMIDMADFAVGLSRQLYGLTMPSERPNHRLFEQWHPLGPVGVITAFNFPVAVWAWNAFIAAVCGDTCIWKPSSSTPLTAIAVQHIANRVLEAHGFDGVFTLCIGAGGAVGQKLLEDRRVPLISATGSCALGEKVGIAVAKRLGRSLLELGGNNCAIVTESANLELALRAIAFAAVGTAGQRCTTLRRLVLHESIADSFLKRLAQAYRSVRIGDPWDEGTLMGPLINERAVNDMLRVLKECEQQGGQILYGGKRIDRPGYFVEPTLVKATPNMAVVKQETFAPILYAMTYRTLDEAIAIQNSVDQGLSSAIFTDRFMDSEQFLSPAGSDCGIANVNIGTSGAEIGGAFGGEKETGGGREAGSDSWKLYMRRQTCTVNYGRDLPLAQGVKFDVT